MRKAPISSWLLVLFLLNVAIAKVRDGGEQDTSGGWYCGQKRHNEVDSQKIAEVSPCGNTCPDLVKTDAAIKPLDECPVDGWVVYGDQTFATGAWVKRLREPHSAATKISSMPDDQGAFYLYKWSPNGKFITYNTSENLQCWIMSRDGSVNMPLKYTRTNGEEKMITEKYQNWYHKSYREDPENEIYEFMWAGAHKLYGILIDLSGDEPVVISESYRQIGKQMGWHTQSGIAAAAKDIVVWDERVELKVWWEDEPVTGEPTTIYTMPEAVYKGTAQNEYVDADDVYPVFGLFNCGSEMSWCGDYFIHNPGRMYSDCIPNGHHGFGILRVKRKDDPICSISQWWLEEEHGAVSVNWAPREIGGMEQWTCHGGDGKYSNWGEWNFTNANPWVTGYNNAGKATPEAYGSWVVNWETHEWYKFVDEPGFVGNWTALYIDEGVGVEPQPKKIKTPALRRQVEGSFYVNIRGRKVANPDKAALSRGLYLNPNERAKKVIVR